MTVSKAVSFREVWDVPGSKIEIPRMEGRGGRKIIIVVLGLLGTFVKYAYIILVQFFQQMNSYFT